MYFYLLDLIFNLLIIIYFILDNFCIIFIFFAISFVLSFFPTKTNLFIIIVFFSKQDYFRLNFLLLFHPPTFH